MTSFVRNERVSGKSMSVRNMLDQVLSRPELRRRLPSLALGSLLANILALALPLAILQFMDRVLVNQSTSTLWLLALGVVVALVLEETVRLAVSHLTGWIGSRYEHSLGMQAVRHLNQVPLRILEREEPLRHAERVGASAMVADFYSGRTLLLIFDFPFALVFIWVIYLIGDWVVVVPIAMLILFAYISIHFGSWLRTLIEIRHEKDDRRYNFLVEVFRNLHTIKTHAMEAQLERRYELLQASNSDMTDKLTYGNAVANATGLIFSQMMIIVVVFVGAWAVLDGTMTPGGLATCMLLSVRALGPLRRSISLWMRLQHYQSAYNRLQEIEAMPVVSRQSDIPMPPVRNSLEIQGVTVIGDHGRPILDGLTLSLPAGACIGIRGESGSGKSCLMSILNGLDQASKGQVLADGRPLADFNADSVQRQIALLPQVSNIFSGTILQNLTMFDDSRNEAALEIAHKLGLDKIVAGMKLGYETQLGEGANETLPQGVRQIIAIARILVPGPSVILLDESNITLDMQADQKLRELLAEHRGRCILILVTHRPSYLEMADHLYTLRGGKLLADTETSSDRSAQAAVTGTTVDIPERPAHVECIEKLIALHFTEPSDFSNCLCPLLRALKWQGRPQEFSEAAPHLVRHMDLSGLCDTLANLGFLPHHYQGNLASLDARLMPCLAVPENRAALVVHERLPDGRLRCHDGETNREILMEPLRENVTIYVFRQEDSTATSVRSNTSWFGRLLFRFHQQILLALALSVFSALMVLAAPLFVRSVFDHVLPTGDIVMQTYMLAGVGIVLLLDFSMRRLRGRVIAHMGGRTEYLMGVSVLQRVISLPTAMTAGASVIRQVGRMRNFESLRDFFTGQLATIVLDLPAILVIVIALAVFNPQSLLIILVAIVAYGVLGWATHSVSQQAVARAGQATSEYQELLAEMVTQMRTIRGVGHRQDWIERFRHLSARASLLRYRDFQVHAAIGSAAQVISTMTGLTVLVVSALATINGQLTAGGMIATMMLIWRLTGPLQNFFLAYSSLWKVRANAQQIENLMKLGSERESGVRQTLRPPTSGALIFSRVSFRYASDADPALIGVSFEVRPRELVVITGASGAGKSTLLKLIERTYSPQAGVIRLDNIDIRQLPIADLRARLSYMPQQCELFYGTINQNLRLAYPNATEEELQWVIEMAGLQPHIDSMSEGAQTRISNSIARQMPNGFKQQLMLARTLLKPAPVVLLDEPATGLDSAGEEALLRCVTWLRQHATVLMTSHRPGHMRLADRVIYIDRGGIVANGPYDDIKQKIMAGIKA